MIIIITTFAHGFLYPPPSPHGSMQWYVSAYFRTAHDTPHSVSAPPPQKNSELTQNGLKRREIEEKKFATW